MATATALQMPLFDGETEANAYHWPERKGFFSLLVRDEEGKARQSSHLLTDMPTVLRLVNPNRDTWLSQAEFIRPNRRVVNLARIGLLFVDVDAYKLAWAEGKTPEQMANALKFFCADQGIPPPSLIVYSGRGLQAKWLLDSPIPRQALPRWNSCQRHLVNKLQSLGADPQAKDASRVLRLVDTVNTKSGQICHVIDVEQDASGEPVKYSFEYLAEVLLPVARWDIEAEKRARRSRLTVIPGGHNTGLKKFSGRQLAWDRLEDIRKLAELRGGVGEGERMKHLFWRMNFLLLSGATYSSQMFYEAQALAAELDPNWSSRKQELSTLYEKAKAHERGEQIELNGKKYAPLYTPKNDTLITLFQITDEEQLQLRTIISSNVAAERHRKREEARRRAAGAIDRETYESSSLSRQKPWEALGMSRASWYRAGKPLPNGNETSPCVLQAKRSA